MTIIVTHVHDLQRFKIFFHLKLKLSMQSDLINNLIKHINSGKNIPIRNLTECEINYLKRIKIYNKPDSAICTLKYL